MASRLPILVWPGRREALRSLSPLVIGGWDGLKSRHVAAWLENMGDKTDPWALVLRASQDALPYLDDYRYLQGWRLFVNEEPPAGLDRVYLFEDVWDLPHDPAGTAPDPEELAALAEAWPVIVVADPDGLLPAYLQPARQMASHALATLSGSHVIALAQYPLGETNHDR